MDSPLSPIIVDLVMQDLEANALGRIRVHLPFYFRYVDSIVMAVSNNLIDFTLMKFNFFHPRMQFTVKREGDKINFLNITIKNNNFSFLSGFISLYF